VDDVAAPVFTELEDPGSEGKSFDFFGPIVAYSPTEHEEIRQYVLDALAAERIARQDHEDEWDDGYSLLMNRHSFVGKADWQSRLVISKAANTINAATAILKAGVTQTREWFDLTVDSEDPLDKALVPFLKDLARAQVEERDPEKHMDLLDTWILGLKAAMATAPLIFKIVPRVGKRKIRRFRYAEFEAPEDPLQALRYNQMLQMGVPRAEIARQLGVMLEFETELIETKETVVVGELIDPFDFFPDTTGASRYDLQLIRGDLVELDEMTEAAGYDQDALELVREKIKGRTVPEEEDKQRRRNKEEAKGPDRRFSWSGVEFWGVVHGQDGRVLCEDHVVTIIEDIVCRVAKNPFEDGRPYRRSTVEPIPFSEHGRGTITTVAGIARAIIELANAIIDSVKYEVLKAWEVNLDVAQNPAQFSKGIYPGAVFFKQLLGNKDQKLIQAVDTGQLSSDVLALMVQLDRWYQEGSNVTDITAGLAAPMRTPTTATEIADRRQGTNIAFRSLAQWMEKTSLEPILTALFNRMISFKVFGPGGQRWVKKVLGPQRANQFFALVSQRIDAGQGSFDLAIEFKVTALSNIVARAQELEKLSRLLEAAQGIPGFINRLNMGELSGRIIHALGYASEELLKSQAELEQIDAMENEMLARLARGDVDQPRSHSGTSMAAAGAVAPSGT
jgi:hypothetical protein